VIKNLAFLLSVCVFATGLASAQCSVPTLNSVSASPNVIAGDQSQFATVTVSACLPEGTTDASGKKSFTDSSWNPLYHEYLCVIGPDGIPVCGGQDKGPGIAIGNTVPSTPSNDEYKPNRCEKISDNSNCYDQCVLNFITSPVRPPYGIDTWLIPSSGTQCQEWATLVEKTCKQRCGK